jgi:hypothetical protein
MTCAPQGSSIGRGHGVQILYAVLCRLLRAIADLPPQPDLVRNVALSVGHSCGLRLRRQGCPLFKSKTSGSIQAAPRMVTLGQLSSKSDGRRTRQLHQKSAPHPAGLNCADRHAVLASPAQELINSRLALEDRLQLTATLKKLSYLLNAQSRNFDYLGCHSPEASSTLGLKAYPALDTEEGMT